jgi:hypothetical protein
MTLPDATRGRLFMLRLRPGVPVRVPGTNCELQWDGDQAVAVYRRGGFWDLSPLTRPGLALLKERLAERPHLGWWPIMPLASRNTYRSGQPTPIAEPSRATARQPASGAPERWSAWSRRPHHHPGPAAA